MRKEGKGQLGLDGELWTKDNFLWKKTYNQTNFYVCLYPGFNPPSGPDLRTRSTLYTIYRSSAVVHHHREFG